MLIYLSVIAYLAMGTLIFLAHCIPVYKKDRDKIAHLPLRERIATGYAINFPPDPFGDFRPPGETVPAFLVVCIVLWPIVLFASGIGLFNYLVTNWFSVQNSDHSE